MSEIAVELAPMSYVPSAYNSAVELPQLPEGVSVPTEAFVVRALPVLNIYVQNGRFYLNIDGVSQPLIAEASRVMRFGRDIISMYEYYRRAVEPGDLVDVVVDPSLNPTPLAYYWVHIKYVGAPGDSRPGTFKEDGEFALRTKAGEKAERVVAKDLVTSLGHYLDPDKLQSPGFLTIHYEGKRRRQVDLVCKRCGLTVEVKKRNHDKKYRISHSSMRPFDGENPPHGWHAFVWSDFSISYVPNYEIIRLLKQGLYRSGKETDTYADLVSEQVTPQTPPCCTT